MRRAHRKQEQSGKHRGKFKQRAQSVEEMQKCNMFGLMYKFPAVFQSVTYIGIISWTHPNCTIMDFALKGLTRKWVDLKGRQSLNLPPTAFHSSEPGIPLRGRLPASFVKDHGGNLARSETCSGGLHRERRAGCLKRRVRMCRSCFCEQMFARRACLLNGPTARTSLLDYFVLTSQGAERGQWKDWSYSWSRKPRETRLQFDSLFIKF